AQALNTPSLSLTADSSQARSHKEHVKTAPRSMKTLRTKRWSGEVGLVCMRPPFQDESAIKVLKVPDHGFTARVLPRPRAGRGAEPGCILGIIQKSTNRGGEKVRAFGRDQ